MYSEEDERGLAEMSLDDQLEDPHDLWLEMSIRMHAVSKFLYTAVEEKSEFKDKGQELKQAQKQIEELNTTLTNVRGELETANTELSKLRESLDQEKKAKEEAVKAKDDALRAQEELTNSIQSVRESLESTEKSLAEAERLKKEAEGARDADIEVIVNNWLESDAGFTFKSELSAGAVVNGIPFVEGDILRKMREVVEQHQPDLWATLEEDYKALTEKEEKEAVETELARRATFKAGEASDDPQHSTETEDPSTASEE